MLKVSILIPLYNSERFISDTIDSCLNQIYENIEIIIVDDGSTDNSYSIAKEYEKLTNKVKVISQKNQGAQVARNLAFKLSNGDYIQYLDADDLLAPDKINSQMILAVKHGERTLLSSKFFRFKNELSDAFYNSKNIDRDFDKASNWLINSWESGAMTAPHTWLIPRGIAEAAGPWNKQLVKNQDGEYFCRIILKSKKIIFCNNALVYYRETGPTSTSQQKSEESARSTLYSIELYELHTQDLKDECLAKALATCYFSFINHTYPNYPGLCYKAEDNINRLGFKADELISNRVLRYTSKFIGLSLALKFRSFINSIK